jgi:hypothetical protein
VFERIQEDFLKKFKIVATHCFYWVYFLGFLDGSGLSRLERPFNLVGYTVFCLLYKKTGVGFPALPPFPIL